MDVIGDTTTTRQRTGGGTAAGTAGTAAVPSAIGPWLEEHRRELTGHCRRILGSASEAEDAVQETLVRAWRSYDRFEGRAALRSWLRRIATNVCIDMMRWPQRRAHPMDLSPGAGEVASVTLTRRRVGPGGGGAVPAGGVPALPLASGGVGGADPTDPAEQVAVAETVRGAFVTALRCLPPRQRAVLILREVLRWRADEVAELLGSTTASVNSALQRARATLAARGITGDRDDGAVGGRGPVRASGSATGSEAESPARARARAEIESDALDGPEQELLARYVDAFGRFDVESLVALLRADATGTAGSGTAGSGTAVGTGAGHRARTTGHRVARRTGDHPGDPVPGRYRYCA